MRNMNAIHNTKLLKRSKRFGLKKRVTVKVGAIKQAYFDYPKA